MPNNPPAKVAHHGDVLNALPDDETQRALAQLDQLKTWLCFQGGKADAGLSVALSVVDDVRCYIIERRAMLTERARRGGDDDA